MTTRAQERALSRQSERSGSEGRAILGVPARIMVPRIVFLVTVLGLTLFGVLMVFSASSIAALNTPDMGADYYGVKQAVFALVGAGIAAGLAVLDYRDRRYVIAMGVYWVATLVMLVAVRVMGSSAYGATRWIQVGGVTVQPSEFAKGAVVFAAAVVLARHFQDGATTRKRALCEMILVAGLQLLFIVIQPDKGTTGIIAVTLLAMIYVAGMPGRNVGLGYIILLAGAVALSMATPYSRARVETMFHPEEDPLGAGYQLMQGFYAFAKGGVQGVGLGFSQQKYSYLPMPYNDFIFAVVGEELGLIGTVGTVVAFLVLGWSGYKIAEQASDLRGRLIAAGCTTCYLTQFLLNVSGVMGVFPLSGKPVPFVSYGGSSIVACLVLAGLTLSVSMHSRLPQTEADRRRDSLHMVEADPEAWRRDPGLSRAGEATPRSARAYGLGRGSRDSYVTKPSGVPTRPRTGDNGSQERRGLRVVEGGHGPQRGRGRERYGRIDLTDEDPAQRLRTSDTQMRGRRRDERRR